MQTGTPSERRIDDGISHRMLPRVVQQRERPLNSSPQPTQKILRPCPLCLRDERTLFAQRDEWNIVQCSHCGMVFLGHELTYEAQQENHDWLEEYYREGARRKKKHPILVFLSRLTRPFKPETNSRLLAQTLKWRKSGKLVDFGCGNGAFLERARERFDAIGIEMSPRSAALARQCNPWQRILEGPLTEVAARLAEKSFDIVTQFGYIEHEWNPRAALDAAFRLLKPGGVTVLKTPNFDSWNRKIMGADWVGYHIPAHCNYFTPRTLRMMLRQAGFEPLPQPLADRFPTSDSLWMAARRP
ncbi:MAG TPA: class I SAM-dependent methyltransferase [Candidatus Acidoferrales bacterium]|nr:class I SAM-dependent methyltransferase [Candidatus Acidoferrales bacterium]